MIPKSKSFNFLSFPSHDCRLAVNAQACVLRNKEVNALLFLLLSHPGSPFPSIFIEQALIIIYPCANSTSVSLQMAQVDPWEHISAHSWSWNSQCVQQELSMQLTQLFTESFLSSALCLWILIFFDIICRLWILVHFPFKIFLYI